MKKTSIYAVVDLETTGTDPKVDRIIQFGCVLVENGKIIGDFSTDVNPRRAIPKQITNLTKLSNQRVAKAPYFEEIAETIYQLVEGCIFVAHNVHFDYQFLSEELQRCGQPALSVDGVDTVELVQIFYPTLSSFRLNDIAHQLKLDHVHPHQADSDARVTAEILLRIIEKAKQTPLITLRKISKIAEVCSMQTGDFIQQLLHQREDQPEPSNPEIEIIGQIALRKKHTTESTNESHNSKKFPITKMEKEKAYAGNLDYLPFQAKMMNQVYRFYQDQAESKKNLGLEVPTGVGKTLGYLFPLSYLATIESPAVIATSTLILQQQLMREINNHLRPIAPRSFTVVELKSKKHFLNLERFQKTLRRKTTQKNYGLYQMAVLIWLTETQTGDLTEIHHLLNDHSFWNEVRFQPQDQLDIDSEFYSVDFWRFLLKRAKQAEIIVTNHAFLCEESHRKEPILPRSKYLLIDEAHSLTKTLTQLGTNHASYQQLKKVLNEKTQTENNFLTVINQDHLIESQLISQLYEQLTRMKLEYQNLERSLFDQLIRLQQNEIHEEYFSEAVNEFLDDNTQKTIENLLTELRLSCQMFQQVQQHLERISERLTASEYQAYQNWLHSMQFLSEWSAWLPKFFRDWSSDGFVKWIKKTAASTHLDLYQLNLQELEISHSRWYKRYDRIIYTSGTLRTGKKTCLLAEELQIPDFQMKTIGDPFDYAHQAKLLLPDFSEELTPKNSDEYKEKLCQFLTMLIEKTHRSTMVLFTSHQLLQEVYEETLPIAKQSGRELLAQAISGSNEKIIKRFFHSHKAILYGTSSFWDGVDFPKKNLEILIITRLPFDVPQQPIAKARQKYYLEKGRNPFAAFFLPKATLRLKQGIGRLIRSQDDRGILIVTDSRLWKKKYGKQMLRSLPKNLPVEKVSNQELLQEIRIFFKKE